MATREQQSSKSSSEDGADKSLPGTKRRILFAEDDEVVRKRMRELLELRLGITVDTAQDGSEALTALLERPYSVVLTDLRMPKVSGMKLIEEVKKRNLPVSIIVTTGHGTIGEAVKAMHLGATDFLTKPIDIEHLDLAVRRVLRERELQDEVNALRSELSDRYSFQSILSKNPKMHAIFELISNVAQTASTVLVEGETGTGKELIARAIHQASPRKEGPMVAINCAAVPETLLESELFGHEKGSFTGAVGQRKGRFELADGGTLFLDEVGDVPATMQAKLLRVLQERCFERVGGTQTVDVDVRLVAATNRPLQQMVKDGKFREDLYYRLNVIKIELPPLRDRPEDIPLLAAHFVEKYCPKGPTPKQFSPEAMELMLRYSWPGNIRQLENAIERACITSKDDVIRPENLPPEVVHGTGGKPHMVVDLSKPLAKQVPEVIASFEDTYLRKAFKEAKGDMDEAARITGLTERQLNEKIAEYKIDLAQYVAK